MSKIKIVFPKDAIGTMVVDGEEYASFDTQMTIEAFMMLVLNVADEDANVVLFKKRGEMPKTKSVIVRSKEGDMVTELQGEEMVIRHLTDDTQYLVLKPRDLEDMLKSLDKIVEKLGD